MPPKKEEPVKKVFFGRPNKTGVSMGCVGLPNVGKSTFFNLLCSMNVAGAWACTQGAGWGRAPCGAGARAARRAARAAPRADTVHAHRLRRPASHLPRPQRRTSRSAP